MKMMFYINTISYGGAERVLANLANQFSDKGHEVVFVTTYKKEQEYRLDDLIRREVLLDKDDYRFVKKNLCCVKKLRKLVRVERPDILISFMAEPNFRAIVSCFGTKTKTLVSVRNDPNREYPNTLFRFCAKFLYRFASGVVFQTSEARAWFPGAVQKKSKIIFNQVNDQFFGVVPAESHRDIVTVGRLEEQKNHEMLIRAFAQIADQIQDNLYIYGEGDKRNCLQELIASLQLPERVFLPGTISDVPETIKTAKLFVLSSDYEGMPNALIEAMTVGLPCISTDCPCGGPRELFGDQSRGLLVPVGNDCALAKKMLYLLDNKNERQRLADNAQKAASEFSPEIVFGHWLAYANELVTK